MKKLIILSMLMIASIGAKAQKVGSVSQKERQELMLTQNARILVNEFKNVTKTKSTFVEEGCMRFSGKDEIGLYDITMVTSTVGKKGIEVIVLKNNITKETIAYAEDGIKVYSVVKNSVVSKPFTPVAITKSSIGDCFMQYKKGMANCPNCISCINNCWSQNKKWKRISCAVKNCSSTCFPCVKSVWGFIACVFN